nr:hypothetical protein [Propionibacterium sp.]
MSPARRRAAGLLCAAALVGGLSACQAPAGPSASPLSEGGPDAAAPSSAAPSQRPGTPGPTATQGRVASGELRSLSVPAVGFAAKVFPLTVAQMGGAIDPPTYTAGRPSLPVRVADRGVQPASDAADTVYVGCHTSARNGADRYPCNVLIRRVAPGDRIVATTDAGTLTYTVTHTRSIAYGDFAGDEETWRVQPRRLVFVMCDIVDGRGNGANWVVYAEVP